MASPRERRQTSGHRLPNRAVRYAVGTREQPVCRSQRDRAVHTALHRIATEILAEADENGCTVIAFEQLTGNRLPGTS
ncbi:macro domain-containing protein [Halorientalis sp.]|uniref:macro domain-containing protein n=1 Tax=Halorientalis sp. TaxID=1931229 RepID=UPI0032C213E7